MDEFAEMSVFGSGVSQETTSTGDQQIPSLSGYVAYLSLVLQLIMTMVIFLMAGWVFITIKATRSLHKPHDIFVANLMITGMILVIFQTAVTIDYVIGVDLLSCKARQFFFSPIVEVHFTYLMISFDKVIGVAFPYKHKRIMTPRAVASIIIITWALAISLSVDTLLNDYDSL
ncbi:olfactory receptor 11A1-like [Dysidea avara]|uniref:olfactory receptor 11A1-like n=1 Tax=Dysidea avara TaxID=196820 RepID=UPI00332449F5